MRKFAVIGIAVAALVGISAQGFCQEQKPEAPEAKAQAKDKPADKKAEKRAKAEKLKASIALNITAVDVKVFGGILEKLFDLPTPDKGYKEFRIALKKDGTPVQLQSNWFNSDGACAIIPGNWGKGAAVLAPEGSSGFGSKRADLVVIYLPFEMGEYQPPALVEPVASEQYPGFFEYHHRASGPGLMLVMPK